MAELPLVSVILPVLNEGGFIEAALGDFLAQDYEGPLEVVVAEGGSADNTREILEGIARSDPRLRIVDNPERRQAFGLNRAAALAGGSILVRADGHSRYAADFVSASVRALEELGGAVGGRMNPVGRSPFEQAVAAAMNNPLTMGPARFHHATEREEADTVYLGCFAKDDFDAVSGFRSFPSGSSEDADFYFRWRQSGRQVHVIPEIRTEYTPRGSVGALWRQYWRYGLGKAEMLWLNRRFPSLRPLAPMALVIGLLLGLGLGFLIGSWLLLAVIGALWLLVLAWVGFSGSASMPLVMLAAAEMHLSYGLGVWAGLLRGPGPIQDLRA